MMSDGNYQDRTLTCRDCGQEFTFSAGEQEFYASRGLTNAPARCPSCRSARRSGGGGGGGGQSSSAPRSRGEQYEAVCASCGRQTTVPFVPREDRPVYCSDCFQAQRASRGGSSSGQRDDSRGSYSSGGGGGGGSRGGSRGGGRDRGERREYRDNRW